MRYLLIPAQEVSPCDLLQGTKTELRLIEGLRLWGSGKFDAIIVCGGVYLPQETQTTPAARIMKEWLVSHGVPAENTMAEERSRDTYENISYALEMIGGKASQITVVTHWQHALRFRLTFRLAHKMKVRTEPMYYWTGFKSFALEWAILLVHLFDPSGTGRIARWNRKSRTYRQ